MLGTSNYRPVYRTLILGKIMEWLIWNSVDKELKKGKIINANQHRFNKVSFFTEITVCLIKAVLLM